MPALALLAFAACDSPLSPQLGLGLSQGSVEFRAIRGSTAPLTQTITVSNTGGGRLGPVNCTSPVAWLTCSVSDGNRVTLTANPTGFTQNPPQATVTLSAPGTAQTVAIAVDLRLDAPVLTLSTSTVTFFSTEGTSSTTPASATVNASNTGAGTLGNLGTLACAPTPPNTRVSCVVNQSTGALSVAVSPAGLEPGTYIYPVTVTAQHSSVPQTFAVALTVGGRARMALSSQTLLFEMNRGQTQTDTQTVSVTNVGTGSLGTIGCSSPVTWLTCSVSGTTVRVIANVTGLTVSPSPANITISATEAINSPQTVAVTLALVQPVLSLTADTATFTVVEGTTTVTPSSRVIVARNIGADTTVTLLGTLTCTPPANSPVTCAVAGRNLTLTVNPTGLTEGVKVYPVLVTAQHSNVTRTVAVTVDVERPVLALTPTSATITGAGSVTVQASNAAGLLANLGTIACTEPANITCTVNQSTAVLTITTVPAGLVAGTYIRTVNVTAANAPNTQTVTIVLIVP